MNDLTFSQEVFPIHASTDASRTALQEQYKVLLESINQRNQLRESANSFWTTIVGLSFSATAYIREVKSLYLDHKSTILWTLILFGVVACLSWIFYLIDIRKSIDLRQRLVYIHPYILGN
jgi:hypothetical protein